MLGRLRRACDPHTVRKEDAVQEDLKAKPRKRLSDKRPPSLTEQVYDLLRADILTCALEPGQELNEADLADRFGMSKTPVREALANLRQEGLVRTFPRRGYQVTPITFNDMNELFDIRTILEAGAAEIACRRLTPEAIAGLKSLADVIYSHSEQPSLRPFIDANRNFHLAIAQATGNTRLTDILARQIDALERFFYLGARLRDVSGETTSSHHRIVEVLATGDPVQARAIVIEHNEQTRQGLFSALAAGYGLGSVAL